jgi:hypothetical protein
MRDGWGSVNPYRESSKQNSLLLFFFENYTAVLFIHSFSTLVLLLSMLYYALYIMSFTS